MADQGKWFKLWCTALGDAELENLTPLDWYCWVRLGAYIKLHGTNGSVEFKAPGTALLYLFRAASFPAAINTIKRFPHCAVEEIRDPLQSETDAIVSFKVTYQNWHKYQADYSYDRVQAWRAKRRKRETLQEEKRRDVEEKRRDVSPLPPLPSAVSTPGKGTPKPKLPPGHYDIPDSEIMGPEEFKKIKAKLEPPELQGVGNVQDDDIFSGM